MAKLLTSTIVMGMYLAKKKKKCIPILIGVCNVGVATAEMPKVSTN